MKKFVRVISYVLVALVAAGAGFFGAAWVRGNDSTGYSKLQELEDLIESRFIGESDRTVMEDAAAEAMVDSLGDRWSYYITAEDYASYAEQMANEYVGIGVTIQKKDEDVAIRVTKVNPGSPAEEAGMQVNDYIIRVNGLSTEELGMDKTKNQVRGQEGTQVEITVLRDGEELTMMVTRRKIKTVVATAQMLEGQVGLITIANFDTRCAEETIACIDDMVSQGAKALIFDVRNNPGGYKDELVKVLDYLLPEGPLFRSVDYAGREGLDSSDAGFLDLPFAVLVNEDSYSAAEFFAAAIREYDAGFIVGTKTCGKGYFQNTFRLQDGSAVGLSVGKYFTPNGVSLAGIGITPDYEVPVDEDTAIAIYAGTLPAMEDIQVLKALEMIISENNLDE